MCRTEFGGEGTASADRAEDEPAGSDTASHQEAVRELETRGRGVRMLGVYNPQETEHSAVAGQAFPAAVAEPENDQEDSASGTRVQERAEERQRGEADHRRAESRAARLGKLLAHGKCRSGVPPAGSLGCPAPAARAASGSGSAEGWTHHQLAASSARHGVLSEASHTSKPHQ